MTHLPKIGDKYVSCGHISDETGHMWVINPPKTIKRPDGTPVTFSYVIACTVCFILSDGDPMQIKINSDGTFVREGHIEAAKFN